MSASLGLELKSRRKAVGLTQEAVATQLGVSRPTLTQWEGGKHRPTPEHPTRPDEIFTPSENPNGWGYCSGPAPRPK